MHKKNNIIWIIPCFLSVLALSAILYFTLTPNNRANALESQDAVDNGQVATVAPQDASGTWYGVDWRFTADTGELVLGNGDIQTFNGFATSGPWLVYRDEIKNVRISGLVKIKGFIWELFHNYKNLKSVDLFGMDTSEVEDMSYMFDGCSSLEVLDLSSLNTSNVTNMGFMFSGCKSLKELDLSSFDTSNVTSMAYMFSGCKSLKELDLSSFDTSNVTNMMRMFGGCINIDLSHLDTSNVTNMAYMFSGCADMDLSCLDTSSVTTMYSMFLGYRSESLDLSGLNMSNVTNMAEMFRHCNSLKNLKLSNIDTSSVTDMGYMFYDCCNLISLDLSDLDTSSVVYMPEMFAGCLSLEYLDVSNFDTSNVENMYYMFYNCASLTSLDVSNFNTSNVTIMASMFADCKSLKSLNLSNFDMLKVEDSFWMFNQCSSLYAVTIGPKFTFKLLPNGGSNTFPQHTEDGKWRRIDNIEDTNRYTSQELANAYNRNKAKMAGTYVYGANVVTFNSKGGSDVEMQIVWPNDVATKPADPTRSGGEFLGWYTDNLTYRNAYDFDAPVTRDIALYAKWRMKKAIVQFVTGAGSIIDNQNVKGGTKIILPANPTQEELVFVGWYLDEDYTIPFTADEPIDDDTILYAKWEDAPGMSSGVLIGIIAGGVAVVVGLVVGLSVGLTKKKKKKLSA